MARRRTDVAEEVEFLDGEPPPKGQPSGSWASRLEPLLKQPGRWARVRTLDTPQQAWDAADNLRGGKIIIPEPTHIWEFAARGCEVFAIYRGTTQPKKKRTRRASVRRTQRGR